MRSILSRYGGQVVQLRIVPANQSSCADLQLLFGERGSAHECQCQRYRLARGESFGRQPVQERRDRLQEQTQCGDAAATETTGLLAYAGDEPVGWCAVAPRASYEGLVRNSNQTAWRGREEDRTDESLWAITCLMVRVGHRGHGYARALAAAAVDFARERGARAVEAYPVTVTGLDWGEAHPGHISHFEAAGMAVVHRPSVRRAVVRLDLAR